MVAINFTKFIDKVEAREKRMTIRKTKRGNVGDKVQLYTGMRTKACRKLVEEDPVLIRVEPIVIAENKIGGVAWGNQHHLAKKDGFDTLAAFRDYFRQTYGLPFTGFVHVWEWPNETTEEKREKPFNVTRLTAKDCLKMAWYYHKQNPRFGKDPEADMDAFLDMSRDAAWEDKAFAKAFRKGIVTGKPRHFKAVFCC